MRIGWDLDGTLADLDITGLELIRSIADPGQMAQAEETYYASRRPLAHARMFLHALDLPFVVTARASRLRPVTERWLRAHFDSWPVYFTEDYCGIPESEMWSDGMSPQSITEAIAEAKATVLRYLEADVYIEDSPSVVAELRRLLPDVTILQYGGRV